MKTLERYQWCHSSSIFVVNYDYISKFVLVVDFEQANIFLVHIEKVNSSEDKIGYVMRYVVVL